MNIYRLKKTNVKKSNNVIINFKLNLNVNRAFHIKMNMFKVKIGERSIDFFKELCFIETKLFDFNFPL